MRSALHTELMAEIAPSGVSSWKKKPKKKPQGKHKNTELGSIAMERKNKVCS